MWAKSNQGSSRLPDDMFRSVEELFANGLPGHKKRMEVTKQAGRRWLGQAFGSLPASTQSSVSNELFTADPAFTESWQRFSSSNPRLRDPRVLSALVRRGVPNELRREVWSHCLGIELGTENEQVPDTPVEELPREVDSLIEADLVRTFPSSEELKEAGGLESLRRMLRRLAVVDVELGYCQSINFLVAILFMALLNETATVLAARQLLVKLGTRSWYTDGMRQLRADTLVMEEILKERLPGVQSAFRAQQFELLFLCSKWFLALFATTLEGETLRRVWDVLLCDGIEVVFRIAFALLHRHAEAIIKAMDIDELMWLFQERQSDWTPEALLRAAFNPALMGSISRAELAQRRKKAFERISQIEMSAEIRNVIIWRGGVRPASALARTSRDVAA